MRRRAGAAAIAALWFSGLARADGPQQHRGFYLRMDLGPAYTSMRREDNFEVRGGGVAFGVAVGGAVAENLLLFADLVVDSAEHPTLDESNGSTSTANFSAAVVGLGPGVAYYFMPLNLYLSGSIVLPDISFSSGGESFDQTRGGLGLNLMVGKEWWVSDNWGLGVAGQLLGASLQSSGSSNTPDWKASAVSVVFSATYN